MNFPFVPALISVAAGAGDGAVASYDVNHNGGTAPALTKGKALWYQGGLIGVGLVCEILNLHPDISESLMFSGAALASRSVTFHLAQQGKTTPVAAQGYIPFPQQGGYSADPYARGRIGHPAAAGFNYRQAAGAVA